METIMFVAGGFSDCVGSCAGSAPEGVRTQSRVCSNSGGIRYPVCSGSVTEDCCSLADSFSLIPFVYEACNPSCSSSADPVLPVGTFSDLNNADGSTSTVRITDNGGERTIFVFTREADGGVSNTTDIVIGNSFSRMLSVANPPASTFNVECNQFIIFVRCELQLDGQKIADIPREDNLVRLTTTDANVTYQSSVVTLSNSNVPVPVTASVPTFYYVSPLGIAHPFNGDKLGSEYGEGLLFVEGDEIPPSPPTIAIFSQYQPLTDMLLSNFANTHQIQTPESEPGRLLFRPNQVREFFVDSNTTELSIPSGTPVHYSNGNFVTASETVAASFVAILGSTGFEYFDADPGAVFESETFVSEYDAVFYNSNDQIILVSTSQLLSEQIREGMNYVAGGNALDEDLFELNGNTITYQGIEVLQLSQSTIERNITSSSLAVNLVYSGNEISSGDTVYATGVNELFYRQLEGLAAAVTRSGIQFIVNQGAVLYTDDAGNGVILDAQYSDNIAFFRMSLNSVLNPPTFPTAPPSSTFSLVRQGEQVFLQIASMNVLETTSSSCQTFSVTGDRLTYNGGTVSLETTQDPPGNLQFPNIAMLTVATSGQDTFLLPSSTIGYSIDFDSSYFLARCNNQIVFTNIGSVQTLSESGSNLPGVVEENGQRSLYLGSMLVLPLNDEVLVFNLDSNSLARLRSNQLTITQGGNALAVINEVRNGFVRFLQSDDDPVSVGAIDGIDGTLYAIEFDRAFFTDRANITELLANELAVDFAVMTNSFNQMVVLRGSDEVLVLNGVEDINVSSDQSLRYNSMASTLEILDSSNNAVRAFNDVNFFTETFLQGTEIATDAATGITTFSGPLSLYTQPSLDQFFATNNPLLQGRINNRLPISSLPVSAVDIENNNFELTIGSQVFIFNEEQATPAVSQFVPIIDELLVYLTSDAMPQSNNGSFLDIEEPGRLYYSNDQLANQALFTDRQDVINAIDNIDPLPASNITIRKERDGRVKLVIGGQDILILNWKPMVPIEGSQLIEFTGSTIIIRNKRGISIVKSFEGIASFQFYLSSDASPQSLTTAEVIRDTPGTLILTWNKAFYTNRPDVLNVSLINMCVYSDFYYP